MSDFPKYVNVYEVGQCFGGCEEGGWWYDFGVPLESVRVDNEQEQEQMMEKLRGRYYLTKDYMYSLLGKFDHPDYEKERARGRTSAAGGYDILIFVEDKFAEFFPKEKPRYQ